MRATATARRDGLTFSPVRFRWFLRYLRWYFARNFTAVRVSNQELLRRGPLLVYANHPSWWDPVLVMLLLSTYLPGREGFGPMDAEALEKYPMFRHFGAFPVERGTLGGARTFLQCGRAVLERGDILFVMAQGRFTDPRVRPVKLAAGLARLAATGPRAVAIPLALDYPFWDERKPEALARFGDPIPIGAGIERDGETWKTLLESRLEDTMDRLAEDALRRDASRFHTVLRGDVGVGGIYDHWRRLRAAFGGRSFDPAHGERAP